MTVGRDPSAERRRRQISGLKCGDKIAIIRSSKGAPEMYCVE